MYFIICSFIPPSPLSLSRKQLMLQMAQMQKKFYSEHKNELDLIESEPKRKSSKYSICTHNNVHVSWVRLLFAAIVSVTCISSPLSLSPLSLSFFHPLPLSPLYYMLLRLFLFLFLLFSFQCTEGWRGSNPKEWPCGGCGSVPKPS